MPWKSPRPIERWSNRERVLLESELWDRLKFFQFSWTPGTIPAVSIVIFTIGATSGDLITPSVTGVRIGMPIKLTAPTVPSGGLVWDATVTTNDQVSVWIQNFSGANLAAPSGLWSIIGIVI